MILCIQQWILSVIVFVLTFLGLFILDLLYLRRVNIVNNFHSLWSLLNYIFVKKIIIILILDLNLFLWAWIIWFWRFWWIRTRFGGFRLFWTCGCFPLFYFFRNIWAFMWNILLFIFQTIFNFLHINIFTQIVYYIFCWGFDTTILNSRLTNMLLFNLWGLWLCWFFLLFRVIVCGIICFTITQVRSLIFFIWWTFFEIARRTYFRISYSFGRATFSTMFLSRFYLFFIFLLRCFFNYYIN